LRRDILDSMPNSSVTAGNAVAGVRQSRKRSRDVGKREPHSLNGSEERKLAKYLFLRMRAWMGSMTFVRERP
jgi:hypothetical protein